MKELETDAAPPQRLVQRGDHNVTHAGGHLPEEGALVLEKRYAGEQYSESSGERRPTAVTVLVTEHHVVHAANQWEVKHIGMGAVAQNPCAVLLIIDCSEPPRICDQTVDYQPARG